MAGEDIKAMVIEAFGGPGELKLRDVPRPAAGPGQVLVRIHAAGTNPVDAQNRSDGTWGRVRLPAILGSDASGVIAAAGPGVSRLQPGDEVFYFSPFRGGGQGTYAEYQALDAEIVARKPRTLDHRQAAALPLAGTTALTVVHDRLDVRAGERVLIHGAAGGVGLYAVQLAKLRGATVVGSASATRRELLRRHGVDEFVDYARGDVARRAAEAVGAELDCVADLVGGGFLASALPVMREGGRAASIVELDGNLDEALDRNLVLHGVLARPSREPLERLAALVDRGELVPLLDAVHPLEDVAAVHRRLESGHGRGKVVLQIAAD